VVSTVEPLILAVETSGRQGSVALAQAQPESPLGAQGAKLLGQVEFSGPMRHSAEIFPAITSLLEKFGKKPIEIGQVFISVGPGSFTGLRIAVTIAKTYALANNAKIVAVDTLDCIAENVNLRDISEQRLGVILDAKRGQFFIAVYEKTQGGWEKVLPQLGTPPPRGTPLRAPRSAPPDSLMTAEEFLSRFTDTSIALIGEGLVFYKDKFTGNNVRILDEKYWNPSASSVYRLGLQKARRGEFSDPLTLTPNYIRGPDVKAKQI
jgi:tRNA threonylcarbamoyladenosine biosynthesis protein TsaB